MVILTAGVFFFKAEAVKISSIFIYSEYVNMALGIYAGGVQLIGSIAFVYTVYARFHAQPWEEHPFYKKWSNIPGIQNWEGEKQRDFLLLLWFCWKGFISALW